VSDEPDDLEDFEESEVLDSDLLEALSLLASEPETFFFFPDLKSVSYQPAPFKRKPAADIRLIKLSFLQFGQVFNGFSLSF